MTIMQFGKYKGLHISEVPESYLQYLIDDCDDKLLLYKAELESRKLKVENSFMARLIAAGQAGLKVSLPPSDHPKVDQAAALLMKAVKEVAGP